MSEWHRTESVLHRVMVGRMTWSALSSVITRSHDFQRLILIPRREAPSLGSGFSGSSKLQQSLLASVPGEDDADVSSVLKATMAGATSSNFSRVLFRLKMQKPLLCFW